MKRLWYCFDGKIPVIILHPDQAHILTVRENARLQGFPDYYHIYVPIKEKYSLGQAYKGESEGRGPLFVLNESYTDVRQSEVVVERQGGELSFPILV